MERRGGVGWGGERRKCRGGGGGCCEGMWGASVGRDREEREWWKWRGWRGMGVGGGEGEKDPRTENKDGNEKQDGIKMLGIIKKEVLFLPVPCCILRIPLE